MDKDYRAVVCDFCLTRMASSIMSSELGTVQWMAPEILSQNDHYDITIDVYAYGMILYQMFTSKLYCADRKPVRYPQHFVIKICHGHRPQRPENIPDSYWNLINQCWAHDPEVRPTFEEIVERLKSDEFVIEEFGMKTDLDQIHDYQNRIIQTKSRRNFNVNRCS